MMKGMRGLVFCAGAVLTVSAFADDAAKGEYSSLRPTGESTIEQPPPFLDAGTAIDVTATVKKIDRKKRLVTLEGPAGNLFTIKAGEDVRNLPQLRAGDLVNVKYYQGSMVDVLPPGQKATLGTKVREGGHTAKPGQRPGGAAAVQITTTVKILGTDPYKKTVAFRDGEGRYREVSVKDERLQHYLKDLKKGDTVQVVYTEAVAVSVEPAKKAKK